MKILRTNMLVLTATLFAASSIIAQTAVPTPTGSPVVQKYTCPMHPEVVQGKPGKCPKCGMALQPKKAAPTPEK
jgi:hypothetical protein